MEQVDVLIGKIIEWIDKLFGFAEHYTGGYGKYLIYALLLVAGSKIFKIKLNLATGGKK
jgi:hypothetical protein